MKRKRQSYGACFPQELTSLSVSLSHTHNWKVQINGWDFIRVITSF